ncbi:MAG: helix-turn-helix domain-containing protein [Pyrinomonadaceae bacterium]
MFDPTVNPTVLVDGLFVSHLLLSDDRLSALAKLLYVFLAQQASPRGEVVPDVAYISKVLGAEGHAVYRALNELDQHDYFSTRRSGSGTEFVHCRFVTPSWLKTPAQKIDDEAYYARRREGRKRGRGKSQKQQEQTPQAEVVDINEGQGRTGTRRRGSEFPLEVCREWALHCERRGDHFRDGVDHFAGWLWKFAKQDHDIRKWLRNNPRGQEVAREFNIDVSRDAIAG